MEVELPYDRVTFIVVCDYVIDELHRTLREKFPERTLELEAFPYTALPSFTVVPTPEETIEVESAIRDPKDRRSESSTPPREKLQK